MSDYINQYDLFLNEKEMPYLKVINQFTPDYPFDDGTISSQLTILNDSMHVGEFESEHQYVIARDVNGYIKGIFLLGIGSPKSVEINRRNLILFLAFIGAFDFYIIHNHPNGSLMGSEDDVIMDAYFKACGEMIEIPCVGDYVVTGDGWIDVNRKEPQYYLD